MPDCKAPSARFHLLIKPTRNGIPAIPSEAIVKQHIVIGIFLPIPYISLILLRCVLTIITPAHIKSVIFMTAWATRCRYAPLILSGDSSAAPKTI